MMCKDTSTNQNAPSCRKCEIGNRAILSIFLLLLCVTAFPSMGYTAEPTYPISTDVKTTRERTVRPVSITDAPPYLTIDQVDQYGPKGYSSWEFGSGVDAGPLLPDGSAAGSHSSGETLLTFFAMSDIHIVDKESPAQAIYGAFNAGAGFGNVNTSAYSPVILSSTQVLDAAIQTINVLHGRDPFDFGISLGDVANNNQYNELRWYIDVIDGKKISPSSGTHRGAKSIDYQMPYQPAGLNKSIPWYQTIGNHDQFWMGTLLVDDYIRDILVGNTVLNMGFVGTPPFPTFEARGYYMGLIDGKTKYGNIIDFGPVETMSAPIIPADRNRLSLSTETSTSLNWMKELFNTTSEPKGHGFTQTNIDRDFTSYTFEPKASLPLKVIVLDDTCKDNPYAAFSSYARACLDQTRYDWLVNELEQGQAEGKLMIIAAHIPIGPQWNVPEALPTPPQDIPNNAVVPLFLSTCTIGQAPPCKPVPPYSVVTDTMLLETLHNYSNLLLWMSGHRHINTVTPQPAPEGKGPEFGFWEVETSSLRDFPQQFRTFKIVRNNDNTVSIFVTDVDPAVQGDSPAAQSRGYAIGANRISAGVPGLTDTTSRAYNAELIKPLPAPSTMSVSVTGPGTVISSPYSGVHCAADSSCSSAYLPGTQVTLIATPAAGAALAGWTPCAGKGACTVTISNDTVVTATFTRAPTLVVTPDYKDFVTGKIGEKATATFTIKNAATKGLADLAIGTITNSETDAAQFGFVSGKDQCSGRTIKPGKTCTFKVYFKPSSANTKVATIQIPSNDPDGEKIIQVTGTRR